MTIMSPIKGVAKPDLPVDVELEQALIGAAIVDPRHLEAASGLRPEQFYDPFHARVWETIGRMCMEGRLVTPLTLKEAMRGDDAFATVGMDYLARLALASSPCPNVGDYARVLANLATRREMIRIGEDIIDRAQTKAIDEEACPQIEAAETALGRLRSTSREQVSSPLLSSQAFVAGFTSLDYVLDGVYQRGRLYSNTGSTGAGKTAFQLRLLASVALGRPFAGRAVTQGRALMLAGENPDDIRMRWIAMSEQMGFAVDEVPVEFKTGRFSIRRALPELRRAAGDEGFAFVLVDTSTAYFEGEDENNNIQALAHAHLLRDLTELPGRPLVVANCHPVKGAAPNNLLPRGGGAFLNEVDGNSTCAPLEGRVSEFHWQGKFRGPEFEPVSFECPTVTSSQLVTVTGRHIPTVIARPLSVTETKFRQDGAEAESWNLLRVMAEQPRISMSDMAKKLNWFTPKNEPDKSRVQRRLKPLIDDKMIRKQLTHYTLTTAGQKAAEDAR